MYLFGSKLKYLLGYPTKILQIQSLFYGLLHNTYTYRMYLNTRYYISAFKIRIVVFQQMNLHI